MFNNPHYRRMIILVVMLVFTAAFSAEAATARRSRQQIPPYKSSGVIPGTALLYEKLSISDKGEVKITVVNPTNNGVAFTARFGFYNNKDRYLTGFTIEGFAAANRKIDYSFKLDNLRAYRNAVTMKVLGRSGRTGRDPDIGDGS